MNDSTALHETFTLTRTLAAPVAAVYRAWADPKARAAWNAPVPGVEVAYDADDFRVCGVDQVRYIEPDGAVFSAHLTYHDIVADQRILYSETLSCEGEPVSAALVTAEFLGDGAGCKLVVTVQMAALNGSGMETGYREGWNAVLDNLPLWLAQESVGGLA
ncbi:SRPBCC family protein [Maricaulis sp.]|uniref:SRPBCC family protein n=1 Tax=Maricaulis sp. TaxID=1486257 RepID=UPI003A9410F0